MGPIFLIRVTTFLWTTLWQNRIPVRRVWIFAPSQICHLLQCPVARLWGCKYFTKVKFAVVKLPSIFCAEDISGYLPISFPNYLKILIDQSRNILSFSLEVMPHLSHSVFVYWYHVFRYSPKVVNVGMWWTKWCGGNFPYYQGITQ